MATRLSYLLWGTMPDAALFDAARANRLRTPDDVRAQAERMLADPRAHQAVARFHSEWLQLANISRASKDPKLFPFFAPELPALLRQETETFLDRAAFGGGGLRDLLGARFTFVNKDLAALYGVPAPAASGGFARVDLDPAQRAGVLTQGGMMAMLAEFTRTSPVRRGAFVRRQLLCAPLGEPPPGAADLMLPSAPAGATRRQLVELHASRPECASCHRLIDPIGVAFETYDAGGRWRATEDGQAIDDRGEVVGSAIGAFKGAVELADRLAGSAEARTCFVRQLFRYALGRDDAGSGADIDRLARTAEATGGRYPDLLVALTQTDAFLTLPTPGAAP
jgi:hypothetical protein